jgi:hypothetical protein
MNLQMKGKDLDQISSQEFNIKLTTFKKTGFNELKLYVDADKDPKIQTHQPSANVSYLEDSHLEYNTFDQSDLVAKSENTELGQHTVPIISHPDMNDKTVPYSKSIFRQIFQVKQVKYTCRQ